MTIKEAIELADSHWADLVAKGCSPQEAELVFTCEGRWFIRNVKIRISEGRWR